MRVISKCWTVAVFVAISVRSSADTVTRQIASGVTLTQETVETPVPLVIDVIRADLKAPGVHVRCGLANDRFDLGATAHGLEPVASITARNGAVAAVNADFFPFSCDPVGLAIRDGQLLSEPLDYRVALGFTRSGVLMNVLANSGSIALEDGTTADLNGINRLPEPNETTLLTSLYRSAGRAVRPLTIATLRGVKGQPRVGAQSSATIDSITDLKVGDTLPAVPDDGALVVAAVPLVNFKAGAAVRYRFDLSLNNAPPARGRYPSRGRIRDERSAPEWTGVEQAVSGGPWLVRNGQVAIDYVAEDFPRVTFVESRHARTAAGVTADGKLLLVTVDRRLPFSSGASLDEMAAIMLRLGAINAINLDGGGSTTLAVGGGVVNAPSDGRARPVADALLVYGDNAAINDTLVYRIRTDAAMPTAGTTTLLTLTDGNDRPATVEPIWTTADGSGFVAQSGRFRATKTGAVNVRATLGGRTITITLNVLPGPPARITAALGQAENDPPDRSVLRITVMDAFGNPVSNQVPMVQITGGQAETVKPSDAAGKTVVEIVWDAPAGSRTATVSVNGVQPITLTR